MRKSILAIAIAILSAVAAWAEQPRLPKLERADTSGKPLPLKRAPSANACAAYGAGFVKLEGTETCVKIGGAVSIGAGASTGPR
jgi:hypothetical protein